MNDRSNKSFLVVQRINNIRSFNSTITEGLAISHNRAHRGTALQDTRWSWCVLQAGSPPPIQSIANTVNTALLLPSLQADFYTKIRSTWDNNYVGSPEEAQNKPFCGTLNATQETTFYGKWWAH
jgi:hypothetical protein